MKHIVLCWLGCMAACMAVQTSGNLIPNPGLTDYKGWHCNNRKIFTPEVDGQRQIIAIRGTTPALGFQRVIQVLERTRQMNLQESSWELSVEALVQKLTGTVRIAVRQVDEKGMSITYTTLKLARFDESQEWQTFRKVFVPHPQTRGLNIHVTADYLESGELVKLANLTLREVPR